VFEVLAVVDGAVVHDDVAVRVGAFFLEHFADFVHGLFKGMGTMVKAAALKPSLS
jgi:hypothetical protein